MQAQLVYSIYGIGTQLVWRQAPVGIVLGVEVTDRGAGFRTGGSEGEGLGL